MIERIILATCQEEYAYKLANELIKGLIMAGDTNTLLVQTKEAPMDFIHELVDNYKRADGQYVFNAEFMTREEVLNKIKEFCKCVNLSILPKNRKLNEDDESVKQRFGYIEYTEIKQIWKE